MDRKRIFDILIGFMIGVIVSFVTMMIIDGHSTPESAAHEDPSYSERSQTDAVGRDTEHTEAEVGSSKGTESVSETKDSEEETTRPEKAYEYESITDYFRQCDPDWNESKAYQEAIAAYDSSIGQDMLDEMISTGSPRFELAYIDEDDIPELLLGISNHTPDGIFIFKYIAEKKEVVRIGEFSQFGRIEYVEHGNRIASQYGNQGLYMVIVSRLNGDKSEAIGSVASDGTGRPKEGMSSEEIYHYAGYTLPDGADGTHKDNYPSINGTGPDAVQVDYPEDEYIVSEEEYNNAYDELMGITDGAHNLRTVKYDDMDQEINTMHTILMD